MTSIATVLMALTLAAASPAPVEETRDAAIARLEKLSRQYPRNVNVLLRLGGHLVRRADEVQTQSSIHDARDCLSRALSLDPGSAEARAWAGVLRCIEAKYGSGASAKSLALQGLKEIDEAVRIDPDHLGVVLMRASVSLQVPREWGRLPQAREDLERLEHLVRRRPSLVREFNLDLAEVYCKLGEAQLAAGDRATALQSFAHAAKTVPSSPFAKQARRLFRRNSP